MLEEGDKVPAFTLDTDIEGTVSHKDLKGSYAVLYFYPKDSTPGCTREAEDFTKSLPQFRKLGARVFGISKDSQASHSKFREKFGLKVTLASDPELTVHNAFGAYGEKTLYGKKVEGTLRSTFVITPEGKVGRIFRKVKVDGHAGEVLECIRSLALAKGKR